MKLQVVVSHLTPAEAGIAEKLFETTIPDTYAKEGIGHLEEDMEQEIHSKKKLIRLSLDSSRPEAFLLVAKIDDTIVGCISYAPCGEDIRICTEHQLDDVGELGSLYVLPNYQGQGVGSALIKAMTATLNERGIEKFCLDSGYKIAQQKWLHKFGKPYAVVEDYWGPDTTHMVWLCNVKDFLELR
ncbi:GNAT family N-acetyltransferase [Neobacillus mesonae]|nr:GNAT family N-acetyltransferase [Neobacillus mesonae]